MFFEFQSALLKSWLEMAETSTKMLVETSAEFQRTATEAWAGALGMQRPATPLFPFAFPGMPGATAATPFNPFQPAYNPMASVFGMSMPFASMFMPQQPAWTAFMPWAGMMSGMSSMAGPFGQQPTFADVIAASYRTAGGHAAAAIAAPFQGHTVPALWWTQPAGRGWIN